MTPRPTLATLALAAAASMPVAAVAATATTEPAGGPGPGCQEITAALDAVDAFAAGMFAGRPDDVEPLLATIPDLGAAAEAAAPPEIADAVSVWVAPFPDIAAALGSVDLGDLEALVGALSEVDTAASDAALVDVQQWAAAECGWAPATELEFGSVAEPPDCELLDPAIAAAAAGIDVDVDDADGVVDFNVPTLWTKSCSYGNGALSLSTLSFSSVDDARAFYFDNLEESSGVVLDVDLGSLPESSLAIETGVAAADGSTVPRSITPIPAVQVVVLEAPAPFSVTISGEDVDPAAVVAAAEAVLEVLAAGAPTAGAPATTLAQAPTTA